MLARFVIAAASVMLLATSALADKPVKVMIYDHSGGSAGGPKNLKATLTKDHGFECKVVTPDDIRSGVLKDADVLIMPGGSGSGQAKNLGDDGRATIKDFVKQGGGYVGICAGSYLASSDYDWSLHLINAKVFDRAHWARGTGTVTLDFTEAGKKVLEKDVESLECYYGQGPLLVPDTKKDLPAYEPLASYATEIAKKGAPKGVMVGTTAIARAPYGEGRVICYSPHPEKPEGPRELIRSGVAWAAGRGEGMEASPTPSKPKAKTAQVETSKATAVEADAQPIGAIAP